MLLGNAAFSLRCSYSRHAGPVGLCCMLAARGRLAGNTGMPAAVFVMALVRLRIVLCLVVFCFACCSRTRSVGHRFCRHSQLAQLFIKRRCGFCSSFPISVSEQQPELPI